MLESALRNRDGKKITEQSVNNLAAWRLRAKLTREVPLVVARVLMRDMTGVPLVADFAAA